MALNLLVVNSGRFSVGGEEGDPPLPIMSVDSGRPKYLFFKEP